MSGWAEKFVLLIVMHALTDYALQSEHMARLKSPKEERPDCWGPWWWTMLAHSLINGLGVWMITGHIILLIAETFMHLLTDTAKCQGWIGTKSDQLLHIFHKALWAAV